MDQQHFQSILLATDFSDRSANAERQAVALTRLTGGVLHVVTAIEPIMGVDAGDEDADEFAQFYEKLIRRAETELEARRGVWGMSGAVVRHHVKLGHRWQVVLETADAVQADVLVLGKRPLAPDMAFGTTSQKVFLASARPVLFVPA